jgi:phosphotransferase system HPr (HPr) family protein
MKQVILQINTDSGLHARPAALFVEQTSQLSSEISIRNLTTKSEWVDAKSILNVLTLGVEMDHEIELQIEGADEQEAIEKLTTLIARGLHDHS